MEEHPLTATELASEPVSEPAMCRGCEERDREILRLRKQLGLLEPTSTARRGAGWWGLLILGLIALALMPSLSLLVVIPILVYDSDFLILTIFAQGALYATPVAPYATIGMLAVLHWRPARQRIPVGFGVAALMVLVTTIAYASIVGQSTSLELLCFLAPSLPIAVTIACCPIFVARSIFGWSIGLSDQAPPQRSTTLLSCLGVIAFIGAATACLRFTDTDELGEQDASQLAIIFTVYVAAPSAIVGCVLTILAPAVLRRRRLPWRKYAACLIWLALASVLGPLPYLLALTAEADAVEDLWSAEMVVFVISYGGGITAIASLWALAVLGWVRLLGYRLYTKSECIAEGAPASG
jgi:hypothetical protein